MKKRMLIWVTSCWLMPVVAVAQSFRADVDPLIAASCMDCHDADTETRLNLEDLGDDLTDPDTFRRWESIFDRVIEGEMPPSDEPRPEPALMEAALGSLEPALREASLATQRRYGRVPSRRLTRLEYEYTLRDLLLIEEELAGMLPAENDSGGFDTVGSTQRISPVHIRSYLRAADRAIDAAIQLGTRPPSGLRRIDYVGSPYVNSWHDKPLQQGGSVTRKLDDAVVLFVDLDYIMRSDASGFAIHTPGFYRITAEAYAYQAETPVTLKLVLASERRGGAVLLGAFDLLPGQTRSVEVTAFMTPGDYLYPSLADAQPEKGVYFNGGADGYRGEGLAVKSVAVEGPLLTSWPPPGTRRVFDGWEFPEDSPWGGSELELTKEPIEHVRDVVARMAPLAFRRPPVAGEIESFVALAEPAIEEGRPFSEVVRVPLRAMFSSPQFLFFDGSPGELDDYALANRLSYFLWRSMPDDELFELAEQGDLSDPEVLRRQVDRMLNDEKSVSFVRDFLGQWLELDDINATTPDENLYPEFDDVLNQAIARETELFFAELIRENLGVGNLIDSDFTFLNRRLAEHYGIPDIAGQHFRRVTLPADSPRGGVLTQASILKVTANGTVTSPVTRGSFVLTNLLGQPPDPPPPSVGSIEPDTRGTTTIRELLAAHREIESCARCHRAIDPPGFALESFDPIGGFRTRYRAGTGRAAPGRSYRDGPEVDASGLTSDGRSFSGIREFKDYLIEQDDEIASHFIAQLVIYATGSEIQFADREEIARIAERTRDEEYPVRDIIHEIVLSRLFRQQ